jgi:hypothetical protein
MLGALALPARGGDLAVRDETPYRVCHGYLRKYYQGHAARPPTDF